MGGQASVMDDATQQAIQDDQARIIGEFVKQFPFSYKNALIAHCKEAAEAATADKMSTRKLPDCDAPSYVIKQGIMKKSAPSSWRSYKERFFVACNEDKNWDIEYYESEGGQLKGTVCCKPLWAHRFNSLDREEHPFGVKLEPWWSGDPFARTWYFRVETEKEEDEWYDVLRHACYKARAPLDYSSPVVAQAFKDCLKFVAWQNWVWIDFDSYNEEECLVRFIFYIIEREHLRKVYDGLSDMGKDTVVNGINQAAYTAIKALVVPAWATVKAAAQGVTDQVTGAVQKGLQPLCDAEADFLTKVGEMTEKTIGAALKELTSKLFPKTMGALALPIGGAYAGTARGLKEYLTTKVVPALQEAGKDNDKIIKVQIQADRQVHYGWSGPLEESTKRAREIPTLIQDDAAFSSGTGMSPWDVHWKLREATQNLYRSAINKFFDMHRAQVESSTDASGLVPVIVGEFLHDAPDCVLALYMDIFSECLHSNSLWRDNIVTPMKTALEPMAETIAAVPVVGDLIDLMAMLDKTFDQILESTLSPSIAEATGKKYLDIEAIGTELGADAAALA